MAIQHFGLIGYPLGHSFSKKYFTEKFDKLGLSNSHQFHLFPIEQIELLPGLLNEYKQSLIGFSVTIPYKQQVLTYLQEIDPAAAAIGAVNCVKILENGTLKGYNTDYWGFRWTLEKWGDFLLKKPKKALVLGKGGAAKAIEVALRDLGLEIQYVSRVASENAITYDAINETLLKEYTLLVNTSPVGMSPNVEEAPAIPYHLLNSGHLLYDIVYNPLETKFLQLGKAQGASVHTGLEMLHGQAEKAWEIWNG
jgi:shikimate dehydrogenase